MYYAAPTNFALFVSLFIGTGFIAGSIVHFGEGITIWDSAILAIGVLLFVTSSYIQEYRKSGNSLSVLRFTIFIVQSLFLAIGIGMASGGTQHFIDTPAYSAILIPLGLWIGFFSFLWREYAAVLRKEVLWLTPVTSVAAVVLWLGLTTFNALLPDSLRVGHGSHGVSAIDDAEPSATDSELEEGHAQDPHAAEESHD